MSRQERRHQERLAKKQEQSTKKEWGINVSLLQPWSVPVMKTTLPPDILQAMIEISDQIIADKGAMPWGKELVGQIEKELLIENEMLVERGVQGFFLDAIRHFVFICKCQQMPDKITQVQQEEWYTQILNMWIVSQQPGEYNPIHVHTQCLISTVMYLKVPKILPSRKEQIGHRSIDGAINFTSNVARDHELSAHSISIQPQVGDFYIFGAHQLHSVYPYRCEEGQEDVERRSISFNAIFQSKSDHDKDKIVNPPQAIVMPGNSSNDGEWAPVTI